MRKLLQRLLTPAVAASLLTGACFAAEDDAATLEVGKPAPPFKVKNQDDKDVSPDDYKGKWLILYFYPKDDTPG